jgi:cytochrome c oxidase assembly protein subunit 15
MAQITPKTFRIVCGVAFSSLCIIVVSGALVRLTGSGLGCSDWPQCNETKFVDVSSGHTLIEQANRLFTGFVSASVILAVLMAYLIRPRRKDLILLAWSLVIGVLAQIVIGGIVVLTGLNPYANMAHFLVSIVLVTCSYALMRRSAGDARTPLLRTVPSKVRSLLLGLFVFAIAAIVTGTVVTATGPHAGDEDAIRFGFELTSVARIHSATILTTIGLIVFLAWKSVKDADFFPIREPVQSLLFASVAQAAIGYTQYFTGVPAALVAVHIVGSLFFFVAVLNILLSPQT